MSDPLRTDGARAHADVTSASDRDAKIEQLLLVGLDHYFASRYELAINVWTRALFLDRSHARARAYIERARSALAERQRESEELLQNGVAAFQRGDADEARRLLHAAIDGGAPSEEALAVLDRLNRFESTLAPTGSPRLDRAPRERASQTARSVPRSLSRVSVVGAIAALATIGVVAMIAAWNTGSDWRSFSLFAKMGRSEPPPSVLTSVPLDASLPLPRRGETALLRARALAAAGHLRDALVTLEAVRDTDAQRADANRLRADIQQQLLALTAQPARDERAGGKGEPRDR
jgi:tetratricopeptide (TPR) repeat protein